MKYDVVPRKGRYRGMGRSLTASELYTKQTKREFEDLLNLYYDYLTETEQEASKTGLLAQIQFCSTLIRHGIPCEVIAYDLCPLESAFGFALDFLGFDIVHEMAESLLEGCTNTQAQKCLNDNGLCRSAQDAQQVVPLLDHGGLQWDPCYVYRIRF